MDRKDFLKNLRDYGIENTIPNISDVNVKFLVDLIKISKTKNMLEVWTANGFSWINFWIELEKIWWKLLSIDFSEKSHLEALENIREVWLENTISLILHKHLEFRFTWKKIRNRNFFHFAYLFGLLLARIIA